MEHACICNFDDKDYDVHEFSRDSSPVARKCHKCTECHGKIPAGDIYEKTVGKWGGVFCVFKTCLSCDRIRRDLSPCSGFGNLRLDIWDCIGVDIVTGKNKDD